MMWCLVCRVGSVVSSLHEHTDRSRLDHIQVTDSIASRLARPYQTSLVLRYILRNLKHATSLQLGYVIGTVASVRGIGFLRPTLFGSLITVRFS